MNNDIKQLQERLASMEQKVAELRAAHKITLWQAIWNKSSRTLGAIIAAFLFTGVIYGASVVVPYVFADNTLLSADELNQNFDSLKTESDDQDVRLSALEAIVNAQHPQEPAANYELVLNNFGTNKIPVINALREATGMGLSEANDLVSAGGSIVTFETLAEAQALASALEAAGADTQINCIGSCS